jgi:hypothetical protein
MPELRSKLIFSEPKSLIPSDPINKIKVLIFHYGVAF